MDEKTVLNTFPKAHIKPFDGMSVTADVWGQAHNEHRQAMRAHQLAFHGAGIVFGLEVVANNPPNQFVYISPGVAVDPLGNVIVLEETVAYDFGSTVDGFLYLVLGYGERESGGVDTEAKYTHDEFVIAARPSLPKRPVVELARITLNGAGSSVKNAANPQHPAPGELDLRFRVQMDNQPVRLVRVGLLNLGQHNPDALRGWDFLARECQRNHFCKLIVESVSSTDDLSGFDVVSLSASQAFKVEASLVKSVQAYLESGKILFAEAFNAAADGSFHALFDKLERSLNQLSSTDPMLESPFLFAAPPQGGVGNQVSRGSQIIYSTAGYMLAWGGKISGGRVDIRSAHEWGINLLNACLPQPG